MKKAILLASDEKVLSKFSLLFSNNEIQLEFLSDINLLKSKLLYDECEIIIICPSYKISEIINLLDYVSENTSAVTLIFCKKINENYYSGLTAIYGTHLITLPTNKTIISETVKYALLENARLKVLTSQKNQLQNKIEELKMLDRAKCALIEYLKITEKEAHAFIEKQAMNRRKPKIEIIEEILKTYET